MSLDGHQGGVWGLAATKDSLVSGSTDRTVRIWDLTTGKCTHVFGGHKGTVRCLAIVKPEWLNVKSEDGVVRREKWPRRPLIITGSRDHSVRVWLLPRPGEGEYRWHADDDNDPTEVFLILLMFSVCSSLSSRTRSKKIRTTISTLKGTGKRFVPLLPEGEHWFLEATTTQ